MDYFLQSAEEVMRFGEKNATAVENIGNVLADALSAKGTIFLAGNGGSAADAQHFAAELIGRFMIDRPAMSAVALTTDTSVITSIGNDYGYDEIFSRQLEGLSQPGDIFLAITTSGNSSNILEALKYAKDNNVVTVGLFGCDGGQAIKLTDHPLVVQSNWTPMIQQVHSVIVHSLCDYIEEKLHGSDKPISFP
jgi:D-sedoheptulose 7-phosphate isomerase